MLVKFFNNGFIVKKIFVLLVVLVAFTGCVTKKVRVEPQATSIAPINKSAAERMGCQMVNSYVIEDAHPNNVDRILKNETFASGGNRYYISNVLDTSRGRPSSVVAEMYNCPLASDAKFTQVTKTMLLPGANEVQPISFAEVENNECKVIGNQVVSEQQKGSLFEELANQVYMAGGNRYHVVKVIETDGQNPTSVSADVYRCKHRSVAYE
ncbi:hypothetical protein VrSk94_45580 [Vibrio rotiferianus]